MSFDICSTCRHGMERHNPASDYRDGRRVFDYCTSNPGPNHPFGDRNIGPLGPCACTGFTFTKGDDDEITREGRALAAGGLI